MYGDRIYIIAGALNFIELLQVLFVVSSYKGTYLINTLGRPGEFADWYKVLLVNYNIDSAAYVVCKCGKHEIIANDTWECEILSLGSMIDVLLFGIHYSKIVIASRDLHMHMDTNQKTVMYLAGIVVADSTTDNTSSCIFVFAWICW